MAASRSNATSGFGPVEGLVEEFVARLHAGESIAIDSFCALHPVHADELRELLPALVALEHASDATADHSTLRQLGRYRIVREIGRGGMGVVFEAVQEPLGRRVALKVLPHHRLALERDRLRFQREAELAARLDDPGICTVYDSGVESGLPYIAMRFVEGQTLSDHIDSTRSRLRGKSSSAVRIDAAARDVAAIERVNEAPRGKDDVRCVTLLLARVARSLHAAHEHGLVHRDVKPGNIMLTHAGEPVILDFGLARADDETLALTQTGEACGTPAYMAPEQVGGSKQSVDARTDVYQLGVTLFECLTLRRPFEPDNRAALYRSILHDDAPDVRRFNPDVGADLAAILARALDPSRRYATAIELALDLERAAHGLPVSARPLGPAQRLWRRARSHPWRAAALAATSVVAIGAPVFYLSHRFTTQRAVHAERRADAATERADTTYASAKSTLDDLITRVTRERVEGKAAAEPVQRELLARSLDFYRTFLASSGSDPSVRLDVARAHQRIALIHREFGELAAAESAFDLAIEVLAADPSAPYERVHELSVALHDRSRVRADRGRTALAERDLTSALELLQSPRADRTFEHDVLLATVRRGLGEIVEVQGRHADAERFYLSALDALAEIEREHGLRRANVLAKSEADLHLAMLLHETGRTTESEQRLRGAIRDLEQWDARHPEDAVRERIAQRWTALSAILNDTSRFDDAADALRNAIAIQEPLVRAMPGRPQLLAGLGTMHADLGTVCWIGRCTEDVEPNYARALELRERLARDHPDVARYKSDLATSYADLAFLMKRDRPARAFDLFHSAIELSREVVALQPESTDNVVQLAHILDLYGGHYAVQGALDEAEPCFVESLALRETLVLDHPEVPNFHSDLGQVLANLAHLRRDQQRFDEVRALDERGFEHQRLAVERNPDQPQYQQNLIAQTQVLASILIGDGDHRALCASIQACTRALAKRPEFHHFAAFFLAHAARLAREDSALEADEQSALVASYERACLDELRATIAARRTDVNALVADPVFEPLRENEEFKKLCVAARPPR